jgi:AraC-like DNA-binding protein
MGTSLERSTTPIIRLAHPLAFAAFLRHIGAPVERHLRSQGLPVLCDSSDVFVPLRRAWGFFDTAAQSEDPMLGWYAGQFVGDHNLHSAFLSKLETAPTLYRALKRLIRMVSSEASHLQLGIVERRDDILFYTHYPTNKDMPGYSSSQAYQLEVYLDLIRHFLGRRWVPQEMGIEYPIVPEVVDEHFGGCRILTSQRRGYLAVPRALLHMAAPKREPQAEGGVALELTKDFEYLETLKVLISAYLADGYPSAQKIAAAMDTSVRTMARRLSVQGLSYRAVLDEVRFESAKQLLLVRDTRISEVARAVGFDDPSHFSRLFRRIGGLSPREYRRGDLG